MSLVLVLLSMLNQVVRLDESILPPVTVEITAVDPFGGRLTGFDMKIDGARPKRGLTPGTFEIRRGKRVFEVTVKGFESVVRSLEITESTQRLMFCLPLGGLSDRHKNSASVQIEGGDTSTSLCPDLLVTPLHCAFSRSPSLHRLFRGRYQFDDLPPGRYLFSLLDGAKVCAVRTIDVGFNDRKPIILKLD
ncbi:MAG: hypothetical protein JNL98_18890 [Bryobacterales bacterium]|nr:hypothetical protein [Bryobacterales bacterium]